MLTELEGAILTEVGIRKRHTAFKVRQAFRNSPSLEWQGSAGSVYPAIKRMVSRGLISASVQGDARGTQLLGLTEAGREALIQWSKDATACLAIGIDSFRLRVDVWDILEYDEQIEHVQNLLVLADQAIASLESYKQGQGEFEIAQVDLAIELQKLRLRWLRGWQKRLESHEK